MTAASELLHANEAAAMLGRPVDALRRWRHDGIGPRWVVVAARVMYRPADVAEWVAIDQGRARKLSDSAMVQLVDVTRRRPAP